MNNMHMSMEMRGIGIEFIQGGITMADITNVHLTPSERMLNKESTIG